MQYIIFDLEATCWEGKTGNFSEVIEIGAVRVDEQKVIKDSFQTFIKPSQNPILSDFCTKLTSISQSDVENAPYYAAAMVDFENWIGDIENTQLLSWGHYDKQQLMRENEIKHYQGNICKALEQHRSLKHDYAKMYNRKLCGMAAALHQLTIPLTGTHHRGIDDARNIAKIFQVVFADWKKFRNSVTDI